MANAGDFGLVTLTGHRREYANMFAYAARAHVVVVRSLVYVICKLQKNEIANVDKICHMKWLTALSMQSNLFAGSTTISDRSRMPKQKQKIESSVHSKWYEMRLPWL